MVSALIPIRPRAVCTRSSANRALPGALVNGDHGVEARRSVFVCAVPFIVSASVRTQTAKRMMRLLEFSRRKRVGCSDGGTILLRPFYSWQLAEFTRPTGTDRKATLPYCALGYCLTLWTPRTVESRRTCTHSRHDQPTYGGGETRLLRPGPSPGLFLVFVE